MKIYWILLCGLIIGCASPEKNHSLKVIEIPIENPAASGFNYSESDEQAIDIANDVMKAMGGRKAWDNTKIIRWTFFGRRQLTWNKHTGDVKIEFLQDTLTKFITNVYSDEGMAMVNGELETDPDSLKLELKDAKSIWINDSYWLVMPFKLKDSGVKLKYLNQDTAQGGIPSHKLSLTFNNIGDTPENMYHVYVDTSTNLVNQWDFYADTSQAVPAFSTPWVDYEKYGEILLSGNRVLAQITDIEVLNSLPENYFSEF